MDLHCLLKGSGYDVLYRWDTVAEGVSLSLGSQNSGRQDQNSRLFCCPSGQHSVLQAWQLLLPAVSPTLGFTERRRLPAWLWHSHTAYMAYLSMEGLISQSVFLILFFVTSSSVSQIRVAQVVLATHA